MTWFNEFPALREEDLSNLRRSIDASFRTFTREYGESLERFFDPLLTALIFFENLLTHTPWPIVIAAIASLIWLATRSAKIVLGAILAFLIIGFFDLWEETMKTIAMVLVCTLISFVLALPVGILMSRFARLQKIILPSLDMMQTMPSFVYLIPVVMLLGIGRVPGLIAVVIYSLPPLVRLTDHGIRQVGVELLEAADTLGATYWQKLIKIQLPQALPSIMIGVNQTIMLSLSMVVIASMIGVQGLGQSVLKAIANQYFTQGILNGLAIVCIAIIFDRTSQAYGQRLQKKIESAT